MHFDVRGARRRLMTQMFFPGETNNRDRLYAGLANAALQDAVTAQRTDQSLEPGVPVYSWNIVLAGE